MKMHLEKLTLKEALERDPWIFFLSREDFDSSTIDDVINFLKRFTLHNTDQNRHEDYNAQGLTIWERKGTNRL